MKLYGYSGWVVLEEPETGVFRADAIIAVNSEPRDDHWRTLVTLSSGDEYIALEGTRHQCDVAALEIYAAIRQSGFTPTLPEHRYSTPEERREEMIDDAYQAARE